VNRKGRFAIYVFLTAILEALSLLGLSLFNIISIILRQAGIQQSGSGYYHGVVPAFMGLALEATCVFLIIATIGEILNWHLQRRYKAGLQAAF